MFKDLGVRAVAVFGLIAVLGALSAGCGGGGSTASQSEIAQAEKHGREESQELAKEKRLELKLGKLERENREAKKRRREKAKRQRKLREEAHVVPPPEPSSAPSPSGTDCGDGVIAGPETSCGFALETRDEYEREIGAGSGSIEAWSEANEQWYPMYCTEGAEHECSGAISATVYWP